MDKFTIPPEQSGYGFQDPEETLRVQLDGGAGRYRTDILNGNKQISVSWTFDQDGYNYFRVFYNLVSNKGATPFLMDLYVDDPFQLTEHICRFIPGSVKLASQKGLAFNVTANLEVTPVTISEENQEWAVIYGSFGDGFAPSEDIFDNLVNFEFPQDLA